MNEVITRFDETSIDDWSLRINARWQDSLDAILDTGRLLVNAKAALRHGQFRAMCAEKLPFGERTAQRLMAIASDARLSNPTHASLLPPSWMTLYEITRLDDEQFSRRLADGTIRPDMDRKDISTAVKQTIRATREMIWAGKLLAAPAVKAGVILEDFEWDHVTWSDKGKDRAAENHYLVARDAHTAEEIVERTRERFACAADDCVLYMWSTVQHLAIAIDVMRLRGFDYKTHHVWKKDSISLGYWNRNIHEPLLIGVKGDVPCPAPGTQWESVFEAPKGEHSEKPELVHEMIERHFPNTPKVELNRRGEPRSGWIGWGNEAAAPIEPIHVDEPEKSPADSSADVSRETSRTDSAEDFLEIPAFLRRPFKEPVVEETCAGGLPASKES